MDNGGWNIIFANGDWSIGDEKEYFPVYRDHKQVAAFKTLQLAAEFVEWKNV